MGMKTKEAQLKSTHGMVGRPIQAKQKIAELKTKCVQTSANKAAGHEQSAQPPEQPLEFHLVGLDQGLNTHLVVQSLHSCQCHIQTFCYAQPHVFAPFPAAARESGGAILAQGCRLPHASLTHPRSCSSAHSRSTRVASLSVFRSWETKPTPSW
jgi:hypothetical protein